MHLDDEQIQRVLHGELAPPAKEALSRHLQECLHCQAQLEEAARDEEWIFGLLRQADHATPVLDAETVAIQAQDEVGGWGRRVAGILLAVAAAGGIAYALPGSPLRAWVESVAKWIEGPAPPSLPAPPEKRPPTPPATSGIAVAPGERFVVHFADTQAEGTVRVSLTDGPDVIARVLGGAPAFTTGAGRLTIENQGSTADFEIDLPRDAPWVEILIGKHRLLLKEGARIVTDAPADAGGRYLLPLGAPPP